MQAIKEFGDFAKMDAYGRIVNLSPYYMPLDAMVAKKNRPITDLLICCEEDDPLKYHSRKLVAKLRESYAQDPLYCFYREFAAKMYSDNHI